MSVRSITIAVCIVPAVLAACGSHVDPVNPVSGPKQSQPSSTPTTAGTLTPTPDRSAPTPTATPATVASSSSSTPTRAGDLSPSKSPTTKPPAVRRGIALPYWSGDAVPAAALEVSLSGDAAKGCVWITGAAGDPAYRVPRATLWPEGYRAEFDPVRIYDEKDQLVWTEGEATKFVSGGMSEGFIERVPAECRKNTFSSGSHAWWVAEITDEPPW